MICPECYGKPGHPCESCGGNGVVHCCDGMCEQCDVEDDVTAKPPASTEVSE